MDPDLIGIGLSLVFIIAALVAAFMGANEMSVRIV